MNEELDELYQDLILDHAKHPHHAGQLSSCTHHGKGYNPVCSDSVDVYLKVDNGMITEISFTGNGCVLSQASASMMTDHLIGKPISHFDALFSSFRDFFMTDPPMDPPLLGNLKAFAGVKQFPARIKCVTLAWHAVRAALKEGKTS